MRILVLLLAAAGSLAAQNVSPFNPPPFPSDPSTCKQGDIIFNTGSTTFKGCRGTNTWETFVISLGITTTVGFVPRWGGIFGDSLTPGLGVTQTGPLFSGAASNNALVEAGVTGFIDPSLLPGIEVPFATDGGSPQTPTHLAKLTNTGTAAAITTTDTAIPVYVVRGSAGGFTDITISGSTICQFDAGGVTSGNFVVASTTTAGRCHNAGISFPSAGWVIGTAVNDAVANASAPVLMLVGDYAASGGGGGGSVSSVGLAVLPSAPGFLLTSTTTNPITATGTINLGASNENANLVFAGPCTGAASTPTWRALCFQDIPGSVNNLGTSGGALAFDLSLGGVQTVTLNANVSSSSFTNGIAGRLYGFIICQNGTGNWAFAWPAGFHGTMTIGTTPSLCSSQTFIALNSTTLYAPGPGIINQ